ncbi:MAG: glyoxalase [Flavobacteriales bacterium CG_4_9_14_3_um_filter_40_17]|nr:glyoxalase [Flavobacteriaceae bacterium]PJB12389.1 MAG: glyoxalase [Flavobacteriales bacterium CG_4_9_14_3_um_filter_40_17]
METRDTQLLAMRPNIEGIILNSQMTADERFQNQTLRPIIKLQNDLLVEVFRNYAAKLKNVFYTLTPERKLHYIENAIQKDIKFRNSIKGMIIGQFTLDEYLHYIQNSSALNKRMMNIVCERLKSNVQIFEYAVAV